jgi:hypothetical protein
MRIREMECIQFLGNFEKQWKGQITTLNQIVEMWDLSGGCVNADFFCNKKVWRSWVQAICDLILDWDGFERWDWHHFSNIKNMGINKLTGPDLYKFTAHLLMFFIQSFIKHLGYYPSPLLCPPTLAGHTCAGHRKRFGNRLINFPYPIVYPFLETNQIS